jgi:hypothetical protein
MSDYQTITRDMYETGELARYVMMEQRTWPSFGTFAELVRQAHAELSETTLRRLYHRFV